MDLSLIKYLDHVNFPKVVGELVRNDLDLGDKGRGVGYGAAFPKLKGNCPKIVYRLLRRTPGSEGKETRKPRLRGRVTNPDGTLTEVYSQWMTCLFQFDCCAETADEADDILWKLDRLIRSNVGLFLSLGASQVVFEEQLQDALLKDTEDIEVRSIRWLVRLEAIEHVVVPGISEIRIRAFYPQEETAELVTRGADIDTPDELTEPHVTGIIHVSTTNTSGGTAVTDDYIEGIDFTVQVDESTYKASLVWLEPGKKPTPGTQYYVRYAYWTAFCTLYLPGPPA
jgi:hypothetical protein